MENCQNNIQILITDMGISEQQFCDYTGLTIDILRAYPDCHEKSNIEIMHSVFNKLKNWFESPQDAWHWYTNQSLIGFGGLTAAMVVAQNTEYGASALLTYINSKEFGGFE